MLGKKRLFFSSYRSIIIITTNCLLRQSVTSKKYLWRARAEAQQPTDRDPFNNHTMTPSAADGEMSDAEVVVPTFAATNNGRTRATAPKAPKTFPVNRHTVREQDREDNPRQHVITVTVSADIQS